MSTATQNQAINQAVAENNRAVLAVVRRARWSDGAAALVREAAELGCRLRLTRNGHIVITSVYGTTATISPGTGARGDKANKNAESQLRPLLQEQHRALGLTSEPTQEAKETEMTETEKTETMGWGIALQYADDGRCGICGKHVAAKMVNGLIPTPREAVADHVKDKHLCNECSPSRWFVSPKGKGPHVSLTHRNRKNQPWIAAQAAAAEKRAAKAKAESNGNVAQGKKLEETTVVLGDVIVGEPAVAPEPRIPRYRIRAAERTGPAPEVETAPATHEANAAEGLLRRIRDVLGADPEIARLKAELERERRRADDLEAKLQLVREVTNV